MKNKTPRHKAHIVPSPQRQEGNTAAYTECLSKEVLRQIQEKSDLLTAYNKVLIEKNILERKLKETEEKLNAANAELDVYRKKEEKRAERSKWERRKRRRKEKERYKKRATPALPAPLPEPPQTPTVTIPSELTTPEAQVILQRLRSHNVLDSWWQFKAQFTNVQKAMLAYNIADRLNIRNMWVMFGGLWNMKNLRQYYYVGMDQQNGGDNLKKILDYISTDNTQT